MSTLEYLDSDGRVSYSYVNWKLLNNWLSSVNSNGEVGATPPSGVNRGKIIEELEERCKKSDHGIANLIVRGVARIDRGFGQDWRDFENDEGYTHLEELLIYQPTEWRKQAREYLYQFKFDLERKSFNRPRKTEWTAKIEETEHTFSIYMYSPILAVIFHPKLKRSTRYEPINFLLAYGVSDPLPLLYKWINYVVGHRGDGNNPVTLVQDEKKAETDVTFDELEAYAKNTDQNKLSLAISEKMKLELSPLDYFFHFQRGVQSSCIDVLGDIGNTIGVPRLWLMKELDFSLVVGQRAAKHTIREEVVNHFWNRSNNKNEMCSDFSQPLSMIFAGPSGNGKTELAVWLSNLLNRPNEDAFHKVDCGKITTGNELFGMSGAYIGSAEGSALNNFISRIASEPESIGVVLLDEIEKAEKCVIHGLYQVLDKGEWTNKRLEKGAAQTEVISCRNIIFIMTTNAADSLITDYAAKHHDMYTSDMDDLEDAVDDLSFKVGRKLQITNPFTDAFIGRVGKLIPFLPMGSSNSNNPEPLLGEMKVIAKLIIEREVEKITGGRKDLKMGVIISPETKDQMADNIVKHSIPESGVRGIQKFAREKVTKKLMSKCVLEKKKGGVGNGSILTFSADSQKIRFREDINGSGRFLSEESMRNLSLDQRGGSE
eukprot:CAMPEP_0198306876 /NCGR_PEP_ID=MMETSP1449-20131203/58635_1 /TAXON_ID=420275 /ORGANISM="Attheya septentrionalis, Strain CCMP2084" /LENGTH=656 /DNA_ID=CAMNT_0044009437 /DNA_START=2430 /DNA_END=4400 /DNA_ORIENTATION=-